MNFKDHFSGHAHDYSQHRPTYPENLFSYMVEDGYNNIKLPFKEINAPNFNMSAEKKKALLLDMNSTFMFGEDRFTEDEDFSEHYQSIGGNLPPELVNDLIPRVYKYLEHRYPNEKYRHCFPSLAEAIDATSTNKIIEPEIEKIVKTFSYHEHGNIPDEYVNVLKQLNEKFTLSLVIDIWAPKDMWVDTFKRLGIWRLFSAYSFSSDHGIVKPSAKPFEMVVDKLSLSKEQCLVIGDSIRRDLV